MKKQGFYFLEGKPRLGSRFLKPGTADAENWEPYKLWAGDLWECKGCGAQIISGVGRAPVAEHYQDGFGDTVERLGAMFMVCEG
jgi:hypothetical protein